MAINNKLEYTVLELIESSARYSKTKPLNLGGVAGVGGGVGGPPGGFIGQLPQTRVTYDYDEIASSGIPASGLSLLDNLNHIRYRLGVIESGGAIAGTITIIDDDTTTTYADVDVIHFSGATITDLGGGELLVEIPVGSGGGSGLTEATANAIYLRLDTTNDPLTDQLQIINGSAGGGGIYIQTEGDAYPSDIEQYTTAATVNSPTQFLYRQTDGAGNITAALIDGQQADTGAGTITGDWIKFQHESVEMFKVARGGSVNIPTGQTYNINGTPHTHSSATVSGYISVGESDGSPLFLDVDTVLFSGATVTDLGGGEVLVSISGSGGTTYLDTTNFDGSLSALDVDVQTAFETLDEKAAIAARPGSSSKYLGGDGQWYELPFAVSFFLDSTDSDISGYETLSNARPLGAEVTVDVSISADDTVIEEFAHIAGEFDFVAAQIMHCHVHLAKTAGVKDIVTYVKAFHRTSGGTETLMGTSTTSGILPGISAAKDFDISIEDTEFSPTDRFVIKIYGSPLGTGTTPTATLYFEGVTDSRIELGANVNAILSPTLVVDEFGGSPSISNVDKITFSGATVTDLGGGDVLVAISGGGSMPSPFALPNDITPAQITATQHNYNPTGLATADVVRLSSDATQMVSGLIGGTDGRIIVLANVGSFPIMLTHEDLNSDAENRFNFGAGFSAGVDTMLSSGSTIMLQYDSTSLRWRGFNSSASSLQGAPVAVNLIGSLADGDVLAWDSISEAFLPVSNSNLVVEELDGSPTVSSVDKIIFSGASVTDMGGGDVLVAINGGSGYTQEEIEDIVGGMVAGNTETNIIVSYDDVNGKLDFQVGQPFTVVNFSNQGSDPLSAAAAEHRLYFKSGGLYHINSGGTVVGPLAIAPANRTRYIPFPSMTDTVNVIGYADVHGSLSQDLHFHLPNAATTTIKNLAGIPVPSDVATGGTYNFSWLWSSSGTGNNIYFYIVCREVGHAGTAMSSLFAGAAVTAASAAANTVTKTSVSITKPTPGRSISFAIIRFGADASDTHTGDVSLWGAFAEYTATL